MKDKTKQWFVVLMQIQLSWAIPIDSNPKALCKIYAKMTACNKFIHTKNLWLTSCEPGFNEQKIIPKGPKSHPSVKLTIACTVLLFKLCKKKLYSNCRTYMTLMHLYQGQKVNSLYDTDAQVSSVSKRLFILCICYKETIYLVPLKFNGQINYSWLLRNSKLIYLLWKVWSFTITLSI